MMDDDAPLDDAVVADPPPVADGCHPGMDWVRPIRNT